MRPSKIAIVKELGSRKPRCLAAHAVRGQDEPELVIVERYPASIGEANLVMLEEDTKSLIGFDHTNVATLIWSVRLKGDVAVLSEWIDGESLESALASASKPSVDILLRVVVDVCEGLAALAAFDGGKHVCGSIGPDDVFLGVDGVTRITRFNLGRIPIESLGEKRRAFMAPEYVRGERTPRTDVYAAGMLLKYCASSDAALAPVIERATAQDPTARFSTTKELAQAIAAATKVPSRAVVSQYVAKTFGQFIEARLAKLEPKVGISLSMTPPPVSQAPAAEESPPKVEPPKIAPPPVISAASSSEARVRTETAIEKAPEPVKVEAPKPEPKPEPIAEPKAVKKEKEVAKIAAAPAPTPTRKPAAAAPDPAVIAKKVVPLPKPKVDSVPNVVVAKKTNGTPQAPQAKAKAKVEESPKAPAPAPPPPLPIDVPITISEPPPSARDELDLDIDMASVRPPPIVREEPKKEEPKKEEPPLPGILVGPKPKSIKPPAKSVRPPAKSVRPAAAVGVEDDAFTPKRSPYRGPLLVLAALVIAAGSFAAGRMTAPDPWPVTPTATLPATTPVPTSTSTSTSTSTGTSTSTSTSASADTGTSTGANTMTSASASTSTSGKPYIGPTATAPRASASGRYSPGGI